MYFIRANTLMVAEVVTVEESRRFPKPGYVYGRPLKHAPEKCVSYEIGDRVLVNMCNKDVFEKEGGLFSVVYGPNENTGFIIHLPFNEVVKGMLDRQH